MQPLFRTKPLSSEAQDVFATHIVVVVNVHFPDPHFLVHVLTLDKPKGHCQYTPDPNGKHTTTVTVFCSPAIFFGSRAKLICSRHATPLPPFEFPFFGLPSKHCSGAIHELADWVRFAQQKLLTKSTNSRLSICSRE